MIPLLMKPNVRSDLIYRGVRPALDLNFAKNKSLVDNISKTNLITFSRASSGTFVGSDGLIQTAATDAARFTHNPITLESLGLLIEEQRTNLVQASSDFSSAAWGIGSVTIAANATNAPDGTNTAQLITTSATSECGFTEFSINATTNTTYTSSVFVKQNTCRYFILRLLPASGNASCWFDLQTGTVSFSDTAIVSATITPYPNGWYRISATATVGSSVAYQNRFDFRLASTTGSFGNVVGQSLYMWGAQVEVGANPSSYIPTTGATVTRAADNCYINSSNFSSWYNPAQSTIYCDAYTPLAVITPNSGYFYSFYNTTLGGGYSFAAQILPAGTLAMSYRNVGNFDISMGALISNTRSKSAYSLESGLICASYNNQLSASNNPTSLPTVNILYIGNQNGLCLNAPIKRLVYWGIKLPQIQNLTLT
ncbi:MAG: hypothetical protein V7K21_19230 [Nostoc sp.]|uniref:phage head spike fiber domain-containing protein n=1 Tax=Nostoc sp. TaxID=1180 RepID=UPI002FFA23FD